MLSPQSRTATTQPMFGDGHERPPNLKFSGHESFVCRYAWLPKAYRLLKREPAALTDEEHAMIELGIGKNMVRSVRFWVEAFGVAVKRPDRTFEPTAFARAVLDDDGFDPFLEDVRTIWLLHWNISINPNLTAFAWHILVNHWPRPEFMRPQALNALLRESERYGYSHSPVTLGQHLDVFLRTYTSSKKSGQSYEDTLDCPLSELGLLEKVGDHRDENGSLEPVYAFRTEPKPEISAELFEYCLDLYWKEFRSTEATLTSREVASGPYSVGQVFRLPEHDVRSRLDTYSAPDWRGAFSYRPSAVQGLISRRGAEKDFLAEIYKVGGARA